MHRLGLTTLLLTGDSSSAAQEVADALGIEQVRKGVSPEEKLSFLNALAEDGAEVVMVGDGINDIPALAGARTSVAMAQATDLAKTSADAVLIANDLGRLSDAIRLARKTRTIIRENLAWALLYNLLALPLAATGFIAPWMAAIGMSASSLVVVGNALRLGTPPQAFLSCGVIMDILYLLIPIALLLAGIAIGAFFWSVNSGQFDDLESPAHRILYDDDEELIPEDVRPPRKADTPTPHGDSKEPPGDG